MRLLTHDSFFLPPELIEAFEAEHDAHARGHQRRRRRHDRQPGDPHPHGWDEPLADVLYGVDNTFLSRALEAGVFEPYRSAEAAAVMPELVLEGDAATPIDIGDVCLNIDVAAFEERGLPVPDELEDLLDPALADTLVVEDPSTSSPGLAFLLATVATFGEDHETGWQAFWAGLRDERRRGRVQLGGGLLRPILGRQRRGRPAHRRLVRVEPGGGGRLRPRPRRRRRPDPGASTRAASARSSTPRVLRGRPRARARAARSSTSCCRPRRRRPCRWRCSSCPVRDDVALPEAFERHALQPAAPLTMDPAAIDAGRERWIDEWTDIVLR